jgi:hypothetical protein
VRFFGTAAVGFAGFFLSLCLAVLGSEQLAVGSKFQQEI